MAGIQDGVANLVSALTGGGGIQQQAKTAEEARLMQVQAQRAAVDKRISDAILAANQVRADQGYLGPNPTREDWAAVGGFGAGHKAVREAVGVDQQNAGRQVALDLVPSFPAGPDRFNAGIGVAGDKMLGPKSVMVQDQAQSALDVALANEQQARAAAGASNASAALTNAKIPGVSLVDDLNQQKLLTEQQKTAKLVNELTAGKAADQTSRDTQTYKADVVLNKVDEALGQTGFWSTGMGADKLAEIGGTDARNLRSTVDTIKANLGFAELQAMRDASKTGGALGNITEKEIAFLQSTVASLDPGQDAAVLKQNLNQIKYHYGRIKSMLRGVDPGPYNAEAASAGQIDAAPVPAGGGFTFEVVQ